MKIIGAYSLLALGGKSHPTAAEVEQLLVSNGITVDRNEIAAFVTAVDGRPLAEVMRMGHGKLAEITASAAPAPAMAQPEAVAEAPAAPEKVEEDIDINMTGLFGDDDEY